MHSIDRLREIKRRLNKATLGPWKTFDTGPWGGLGAGVSIGNDVDGWPVFGKITEEPHIANSFFCAHARSDIPWLVVQLETAISFLKIGKAKFAPQTDNSDVDCFLKEFQE